MLREAEGNLLDAVADALVNTVNTVGIMGKGIALQFKQTYPDNFRKYEAACRRNEVKLGKMFVFETGLLAKPDYIINFPTKGHWRARSKLSDIRSGLADLRHVVLDCDIKSIAVPPLGCGNGGLKWSDVQPLIAEALGDLEDVDVRVYPPKGAPPAGTMKIRTKRPSMTKSRAVLLTMLARYIGLSQVEEPTAANGASLLEIQKLMYFLQEAGEPLKLQYGKGRYGPYADNLNHALEPLEGHYFRGYGDRTQQVLKLSPIFLMTGAEDEACHWLKQHPDQAVNRIDSVTELVAGFASAYGLELLATVHWIATREGRDRLANLSEMTAFISSWNERKGRLFTELHVRKAVDHLQSHGWLTKHESQPYRG